MFIAFQARWYVVLPRAAWYVKYNAQSPQTSSRSPAGPSQSGPSPLIREDRANREVEGWIDATGKGAYVPMTVFLVDKHGRNVSVARPMTIVGRPSLSAHYPASNIPCLPSAADVTVAGTQGTDGRVA